MKVHRVDYRLVPGLTHAMAGTLLSRKCSTNTDVTPSYIGSMIDPGDRIYPHSTAQRKALNVCSSFQSEKYACQNDRAEAAPQVKCRVPDLRLILSNGYYRLAIVAKYVKPGRIYCRTLGNYVSFGKLFPHSPYFSMG